MVQGRSILIAALALLPGRVAAQSAPQNPGECWAFRLAGDPNPSVFPAVRLAPDGLALLDQSFGKATWSAADDSVLVTSGAGSQAWTLRLRPRDEPATATLDRWVDDPHPDPEPPVAFRALPIECASREWTALDATPLDAKPELLNAPEVDGAFHRFVPEPIGARHSALVAFLVDPAGGVLSIRLQQTAGLPELDAAALAIANVARFAPATRGGQPTEAWVALWLHFR